MSDETLELEINAPNDIKQIIEPYVKFILRNTSEAQSNKAVIKHILTSCVYVCSVILSSSFQLVQGVIKSQGSELTDNDYELFLQEMIDVIKKDAKERLFEEKK